MADGGEGTVDVFLERGAERKVARVRGPRGELVDAVYAGDGETAILEMSSASGLGLLDRAQYDPTQTSTFGTGELIRAALDGGARRIVMGIGGSATNDAGTGMLRALGVRFLDAAGTEIDGGILEFARLDSIDLDRLDPRIAKTAVEVAVDVDNPLCGPDGATNTFAAQKGATPGQIEQLERVLRRIAEISTRTLGRDESDVPGAGAAGGLGFALVAFLGAKLQPGVRLIARESGLDELLDGATLCLTGEGKIDLQTLHGKTVYGVALIAREHKVPAIAFGGTVRPRSEEAARANRRGGGRHLTGRYSARGIDTIGSSVARGRRAGCGFDRGRCGYANVMQIDTTLLPVRGDDAVEILRHDHRVIKSLLTELTSEAPQERKRVFEQLVGVLTIHNATEENLIYPAINKLGGGKEESQHLYHETADADVLAFELDALLKAGDVSQFGVKAEKFAEAVLAHIDEEESNALPRLLEVGDPRKVEELAEAVRTFRKSLHFETAV